MTNEQSRKSNYFDLCVMLLMVSDVHFLGNSLTVFSWYWDSYQCCSVSKYVNVYELWDLWSNTLNETTSEKLTLSTAELHGWVSSSSSSSPVFGNRWIHTVRRMLAHMGHHCIRHIGVEVFQVVYYCVINRYVWTNVKIIAAFVIAVPYICIILFICLNMDYESKANVNIWSPASLEKMFIIPS